MKCKGCGAWLGENDKFCIYCGTAAEKQEQPKPTEQHIHIHMENTGNSAAQAPYVQSNRNPAGPYNSPMTTRKSDKNRLVMLLLLLFLGVFGIHCFYAGHHGKGILYLFTAGLCGVGVFIDFIILLIGTPKDGDGRRIEW